MAENSVYIPFYRGYYKSTVTYREGDVVSCNGCLYECKIAKIKNVAPSNVTTDINGVEHVVHINKNTWALALGPVSST